MGKLFNDIMESKSLGGSTRIKTGLGNTASLVVTAEFEIVPDDNQPILHEGAMLFVSAQDPDIPVRVNLSLVDTPDTFIERWLLPGYHPIQVYQVKETGTDLREVTSDDDDDDSDEIQYEVKLIGII